MSPGLLCNFSKQLGLQMHYHTAASFFLLLLFREGAVKRTGCLITCLWMKVCHIVLLQLFTSRSGNVSVSPVKPFMSHPLCMTYNIYCPDFFLSLVSFLFSVYSRFFFFFSQHIPPARTQPTLRTTMTQKPTLQARLCFSEGQHRNYSIYTDTGCSQRCN